MPLEDADRLEESYKRSIERARDLVGELKIVQEHEASILGDDEPPLFVPNPA
jgi:hypothetical protein